MPMSGVMQVARPSSRRPLALVVSPTRNGASPLGRSHAVSIAFADPERAPEPDADLLARLYGFTAREAAVAALLLQGLSPNEAAGELAMTENTVRTHIRHLFDKTGVERLSRPRAPSHAGAGRSRALTDPSKLCSRRIFRQFPRRLTR